jgi:hypothetical protein
MTLAGRGSYDRNSSGPEDEINTMASWHQFVAADPETASVGAVLLEQHGLAYLATVRRDGAPRVHPVSPFIIDGRLIIATPAASPKARDLLRDGRYVLHCLPGTDDAEFRIRGTARPLPPGPDRETIIARGPHFARDEDHIFEYDIEEAASAYWVNCGQPDTYPVRRRWVANS